MNSVTFPIRTVSVLNRREHWSARAKRAKAHRQAASWALRAANVPKAIPCLVRLTRIAPRALDCDNWQGAAKSIRDGVADYLGVNDNHLWVTWRYSQERGKTREYAVRIEIDNGSAEGAVALLGART